VTTTGTVTASSKSRRGCEIKYRLIAMDGKTYEGQASLSPVHKRHEGESIGLLYKPLEPAMNLLVVAFMFYSFASLERDAKRGEGKIREKS
jgi:hypothetical protein